MCCHRRRSARNHKMSIERQLNVVIKKGKFIHEFMAGIRFLVFGYMTGEWDKEQSTRDYVFHVEFFFLLFVHFRFHCYHTDTHTYTLTACPLARKKKLTNFTSLFVVFFSRFVLVNVYAIIYTYKNVFS